MPGYPRNPGRGFHDEPSAMPAGPELEGQLAGVPGREEELGGDDLRRAVAPLNRWRVDPQNPHIVGPARYVDRDHPDVGPGRPSGARYRPDDIRRLV